MQGDGLLGWECAGLLWQLSGLESRHISKIQNGQHKQKEKSTKSPPKNVKK
jgi:hypothetical protein